MKYLNILKYLLNLTNDFYNVSLVLYGLWKSCINISNLICQEITFI